MMTRQKIFIAACCAGILVLGSKPLPASEQSKSESKARLNKEYLTRDQTWMLRGGTSGHDLYQELCASCHGKSAQGDGAAAEALSIPPTDLTRLAGTGTGGEFPYRHVIYVLMSPCDDPHHRALDGSETMPCWKSTLHDVLGSDAASYAATYRLARYLETVQE